MAAPAETDDVMPATVGQPARPRRTIIASIVVAALVLGSMVWGGAAAMQAVAAERQLEALRVADLGKLLDSRSEASELLAVSKSVVTLLNEHDEPTRAALENELLQRSQDDLVDELARALSRETAHTHIVAQSRLLQRSVDDLEAGLDAVVRGALSYARSLRDAAPLAIAATIAELDDAIASLSVVRQGLPSSYSGRAALVTELLAASEAVTASHAAEKAEQERLEAERRAAEEAARRAAIPRTPPRPIPPIVLLWCGVDEFGEIIFCPYEAQAPSA